MADVYDGGNMCCDSIEVLSIRNTGPVHVLNGGEDYDGDPLPMKDLRGDGGRDYESYSFGHSLNGCGYSADCAVSIPMIYAPGPGGIYQLDTRDFLDKANASTDDDSEDHSPIDKIDQANAQRMNAYIVDYLHGDVAGAYGNLAQLQQFRNGFGKVEHPLTQFYQGITDMDKNVKGDPEGDALASPSGEDLNAQDTAVNP